jgi:hypothetical protein
MDEIGVWFEVVRGILPPRYIVRLAWEQRTLIVMSPSEERVALVEEDELATLSPTGAIRLIEAKLRRPESRLAVLFAS